MILIGEKLNGSIPSVQNAIQSRNTDLIRQRAAAQAEAGVKYLDVCASVDHAQEVETLQWLISNVQEVTDVSICIDSPDPHALVAAMPYCQKPGLLNSVSLEADKIDVVFPAIAQTDWCCVALLCDNSGIPKTAEKRLFVLEEILRRADAYGISHDRLFIDPLVVSLSLDSTVLDVFLECTREIKRRFPQVHITSGLSNVSFGLPARQSIRQSFLTLAMAAGMDSAILDPTNKDILGTVYAMDALTGKDEYCMKLIKAFRKGLLQK